MKKIINEEYEKFEKRLSGLDEQLSMLVLTNVMATMVNVYKDENGEIKKDYSDFDKAINGVKDLINGLPEIPNINLAESLLQDVNSVINIKEECEYAMRTLQWIKNEYLKSESGEKDA